MNTKEITIHLQKWLYQHSNIYQAVNFSRSFHECDILGVTKALITTEIEIKVTRRDFRADKNKIAKHLRLEAGNQESFWNIPNKFYYGCPKELIKLTEIPLYAGLLWVDESGNVEVIRKPAMIHKEKITMKVLLSMLGLLTERVIFGMAYLTHKNKIAKSKLS